MIAIVGAGVAGLALGCALSLRGLPVTVFERAAKLTDIGAGLQISPNGWKVLAALGVSDDLQRLAFEPPEIELRLGGSGHKVWRLPMGASARSRWGAPYALVHRADLIDVLGKRLADLAPGALRLNAQVLGSSADGVCLPSETVEADWIIGADGLRSTVRAGLLGEDKPRFTGNIAWRAVLPAEILGEDAPPANVTVWAGRGRHAVTTRVRAGTLVNFVGMVETPEPVEEDWETARPVEDARQDFEAFAPPIRRFLAELDEIKCWPLYDRAPLSTWSGGKAILMGDAAHPMLPSLAQGAVQALEDAWTLAALLAQKTGDAGGRFFEERVQRTARIQRMSVQNASMFHKAGPLMTPVYYGGMAAVTGLFPGVILSRQDWIYGHDVVEKYPLS